MIKKCAQPLIRATQSLKKAIDGECDLPIKSREKYFLELSNWLDTFFKKNIPTYQTANWGDREQIILQLKTPNFNPIEMFPFVVQQLATLSPSFAEKTQSMALVPLVSYITTAQFYVYSALKLNPGIKHSPLIKRTQGTLKDVLAVLEYLKDPEGVTDEIIRQHHAIRYQLGRVLYQARGKMSSFAADTALGQMLPHLESTGQESITELLKQLEYRYLLLVVISQLLSPSTRLTEEIKRLDSTEHILKLTKRMMDDADTNISLGASNNNVELFEQAISQGAHLNHSDDWGMPVHRICINVDKNSQDKDARLMPGMLHELFKAGKDALDMSSGTRYDWPSTWGAYITPIKTAGNSCHFPAVILFSAMGFDIEESTAHLYNAYWWANRNSWAAIAQKYFVREMRKPKGILNRADLRKAYQYHQDVENGQSPDSSDINLDCLLWLVTILGDIKVLKSLNEKVGLIDINKVIPESNFTPLMMAVFRGHLSVVAWLLNQGADISAQFIKKEPHPGEVDPRDVNAVPPMAATPDLYLLAASNQHWLVIDLLRRHGFQLTPEQTKSLEEKLAPLSLERKNHEAMPSHLEAQIKQCIVSLDILDQLPHRTIKLEEAPRLSTKNLKLFNTANELYLNSNPLSAVAHYQALIDSGKLDNYSKVLAEKRIDKMMYKIIAMIEEDLRESTLKQPQRKEALIVLSHWILQSAQKLINQPTTFLEKDEELELTELPDLIQQLSMVENKHHSLGLLRCLGWIDLYVAAAHQYQLPRMDYSSLIEAIEAMRENALTILALMKDPKIVINPLLKQYEIFRFSVGNLMSRIRPKLDLANDKTLGDALISLSSPLKDDFLNQLDELERYRLLIIHVGRIIQPEDDINKQIEALRTKEAILNIKVKDFKRADEELTVSCQKYYRVASFEKALMDGADVNYPSPENGFYLGGILYDLAVTHLKEISERNPVDLFARWHRKYHLLMLHRLLKNAQELSLFQKNYAMGFIEITKQLTRVCSFESFILLCAAGFNIQENRDMLHDTYYNANKKHWPSIVMKYVVRDINSSDGVINHADLMKAYQYYHAFESGLSLDKASVNPTCLLFLVAILGNTAVLKSLDIKVIEALDINQAIPVCNWTPLMMATWCGQVSVVEWLISLDRTKLDLQFIKEDPFAGEIDTRGVGEGSMVADTPNVAYLAHVVLNREIMHILVDANVALTPNQQTWLNTQRRKAKETSVPEKDNSLILMEEKLMAWTHTSIDCLTNCSYLEEFREYVPTKEKKSSDPIKLIKKADQSYKEGKSSIGDAQLICYSAAKFFYKKALKNAELNPDIKEMIEEKYLKIKNLL